jgi:SagB-type dehydrogenase family enzyme
VAETDDPLAVAFAYHERTKHHPQRYARALGYLDWASQPDPFRRYDGAALIRLPRRVAREEVAYERLYDAEGVPAQPPTREAIADFLRHALAVSAWKRLASSRWSLRVNPSSGNLHPTEAYLVLPALPDIGGAGVFHYRPDVHGLERRATIEPATWQRALAALPRDGLLVALTSIAWREAWKYGERAFRYCQHDAGHALAALALAASLQGWRLVQQVRWSHDAIDSILVLDRAADFTAEEAEEAELLAVVAPASAPLRAEALAEPAPDALAAWRGSAFAGKAKRLSLDHHAWPIIDEVAAATRIPAIGDPDALPEPATNDPAAEPCGRDARTLIQQRRSAVALDGVGTLPLTAFAAMLRRALPAAHPPWSALPWRPRVDLALFVHRVDGLAPGLYYLHRCGGGIAEVRARMRDEFAWTPVATPAGALPLYLLHHGDHRALSKHVSCHQGIAADGFFSLAMLAQFAPALRERGAWFYRNLFWETGVVGQVLYLEAEAAGARSTGIGCFFDDAVHHVLGLRGNELQSLYHFTVGVPVEDSRLTTEPGYAEE